MPNDAPSQNDFDSFFLILNEEKNKQGCFDFDDKEEVWVEEFGQHLFNSKVAI